MYTCLHFSVEFTFPCEITTLRPETWISAYNFNKIKKKLVISISLLQYNHKTLKSHLEYCSCKKKKKMFFFLPFTKER